MSSTSQEKNDLLRIACEGGKVGDVRKLLTEGANPIDDENKSLYFTAIHIAAMKGNVDILKIFCSFNKHHVNTKDREGRSPLMMACYRGKVEAVTYLLENDSNIDDVDKDEKTMLYYAVKSGDAGTVGVCLKWPGLNVNAKNKKGETPLIYACKMKNYSEHVVNKLLESDLCVNELDNDGKSALYYAWLWCRLSLVNDLQQKGAHIPDQHTVNLIKHFIQEDKGIYVVKLLGRGDSINFEDHKGRTALHYASKIGHELILRLLLDYPDIDICKRDKDGKCALDLANTPKIEEILKEKMYQDKDKYGSNLTVDSSKLSMTNAMTRTQPFEECYPTDNKGICVIINQRDFDPKTNPEYEVSRDGTDADCEKLSKTFRKYCDILVVENLTDTEILKFIQLFSCGNLDDEDLGVKLMKLEDYSFLVFCVLSHGDKGIVYGVNNKPISIESIKNCFYNNTCKKLENKPKIFIFQACQGQLKRPAHVDGVDSCDFLVLYSSEQDFVSYRDWIIGSYYIQVLCDNIISHGEVKEFNEVLKQVKSDVITFVITLKFGQLVMPIPVHEGKLPKKFKFQQNQGNVYVCPKFLKLKSHSKREEPEVVSTTLKSEEPEAVPSISTTEQPESKQIGQNSTILSVNNPELPISKAEELFQKEEKRKKREQNEKLVESMNQVPRTTAQGEVKVPFLLTYNMDKKVFCIIINQMKFSKMRMEREGTNIDRDKLNYTFTNLNGHVVVFENQTKVEIQSLVNDLSVPNGQYQLEQYSAFIMCILSHGKEDKIMTADDRFINIYDDIIYEFGGRKCISLFNKPKIFIIQACQGDQRQRMVATDAAPVPVDKIEAFLTKPSMSLPENIDFVIALSTIKGYVSYRNSITGSPFIQTLCRDLQEFGHKESFIDILATTRNTLAYQEYAPDGMTTYTGNTLRKLIIFKETSTVT